MKDVEGVNRVTSDPGIALGSRQEARELGLSDGELSKFNQEGWVGPYPLLTAEGAERLCQLYGYFSKSFVVRPSPFDARPWYKSMHVCIPEYYDVAVNPAIVERVKRVIGPDVICWGATVTVVPYGHRRRWHVDVEHKRWPGVSVFVGLRHLSDLSTLKVMPGTHRLQEIPQELSGNSDDEVEQAARQAGCTSSVTAVSMKTGDFFIFAGRLWHGSHNLAPATRLALILQYTAPSEKIAAPLNWDEPIIWSPNQLPCVLAAGTDRFGYNRICGRPRR